MPNYEYFADKIVEEDIRDLKEVVISNHYLPPSWLGNKFIPIIKAIGERALEKGRAVKGITTLHLSNCSLSEVDMVSLANFLAGNVTVKSLDVSKNNIESIDTAKAMANAIKKHPALIHVNIAHCSIGGGDTSVLNKMLNACKACDSLHVGHTDFSQEGIATIAKFLAKKTALTQFNLSGATLNKESKTLLMSSLGKNTTIKKLGIHSTGLKSSIVDGTKVVIKALGQLTFLDLRSNSLSLPGAKAMAKYFENAGSQLVSLNLSKNKMKTPSAEVLLPAIRKHTSLKHLDLSQNWLNDRIAPTVIDLLKQNPDLKTLDLSGNNGLKNQSGGQCQWKYINGTGQWVFPPKIDRGEAEIVKKVLFNTDSLQEIANSNHTCAVKISGKNRNDLYNHTIYVINNLDVIEGKKIRLKVLLAMNQAKKDLYDPPSFNDVPLELMPYLLELVQQSIRYTSTDVKLVLKKSRTSNRTTRNSNSDSALDRLYEIVTTWNTSLLLARGSKVVKTAKSMLKTTKRKRKVQTIRRKRRKFGDVDNDDDDEPYME